MNLKKSVLVLVTLMLYLAGCTNYGTRKTDDPNVFSNKLKAEVTYRYAGKEATLPPDLYERITMFLISRDFSAKNKKGVDLSMSDLNDSSASIKIDLYDDEMGRHCNVVLKTRQGEYVAYDRWAAPWEEMDKKEKNRAVLSNLSFCVSQRLHAAQKKYIKKKLLRSWKKLGLELRYRLAHYAYLKHKEKGPYVVVHIEFDDKNRAWYWIYYERPGYLVANKKLSDNVEDAQNFFLTKRKELINKAQ